jgi:hypothetical protein
MLTPILRYPELAATRELSNRHIAALLVGSGAVVLHDSSGAVPPPRCAASAASRLRTSDTCSPAPCSYMIAARRGRTADLLASSASFAKYRKRHSTRLGFVNTREWTSGSPDADSRSRNRTQIPVLVSLASERTLRTI